MYIIYKQSKYPCKCRPGSTMNYKELPQDFTAPVDGEITLYADDDFLLRTDNTANYLRQTFAGGVLTLTNAPEPMPEPEPGPPEPTTENDLMNLTIDHEYRLTLLELGV